MNEAASPEPEQAPAGPASAGEPAAVPGVDSPDAVTSDADAADLGADTGDESAKPTVELTEEAVVALIAERDEYLDTLQRLKAEFANARRRSDERAAAQRSQAAVDLVEKLLPILDSCDAALSQGVDEVKPISDALFEVLAAGGLERVDPNGESFDPQLHEAVIHEAGDGDQIVVETLRPGYSWNGKVVRAAMVKVQG